MKSLERRIVRLERARQPETQAGISWEEFLFFRNLITIWPDIETAPKFLQPEYRRLLMIWNAIREKKRASQSDPSKESSNG